MSDDNPAAPPPPRPASQASRAFGARGSKPGAALSHERIAADIAAFRKAGGEVEVLGITQVLKGGARDADSTPPRPAAAPRTRR